MKKILLLLLIVTMNLMLRAQVITINPPTINLQAESSDISADALAQIQNNSSISRTIKWVRYEDMAPAPWYTAVCDNMNCYDSTKNFNVVTIAANSQGLLSLNVYPKETAGTGSYHFVVFDVNDSINANASEAINVSVNPTGISGISDESFSIYPNPAKDVLNLHLDASKHVTTVDVHNIVGEKIRTVAIQTGSKSIAIPVADLKKGIYFIRILSNGKEISTMTFSKD